MVTVSAPALLVKPDSPTQLSSGGGSGPGLVTFFSHSLEVCSISSTGLLIGLNEGKCIIAAHKGASGIYADAVSSSMTIFVSYQTDTTSNPAGDPNHSTLCQEPSYSLLKNSATIYVDLCEEDAAEIATLEVGTKSKAGRWSYVVAGKQKLDSNGVTIFKLNSLLKDGQLIRVKVENKVQISTLISRK